MLKGVPKRHQRPVAGYPRFRSRDYSTLASEAVENRLQPRW
jgi:hypothetical protein